MGKARDLIDRYGSIKLTEAYPRRRSDMGLIPVSHPPPPLSLSLPGFIDQSRDRPSAIQRCYNAVSLRVTPLLSYFISSYIGLSIEDEN